MEEEPQLEGRLGPPALAVEAERLALEARLGVQPRAEVEVAEAAERRVAEPAEEPEGTAAWQARVGVQGRVGLQAAGTVVLAEWPVREAVPSAV